MGVDSSIGAGAILEISSSLSFKKSLICVAVAVMLEGAAEVSIQNSSSNMIGRNTNRLQTYVLGSLVKDGSRSGMRFIQLVRRDLGLPLVRYHIHS
uniref:Uncharacterized protein n=1 Tax=Romanomermis culicivorax TaxID=13658 RepID=A0A915I2F8_ROMCU